MLIKNYFYFASFFFPLTIFTKEVGLYHVGTVAIDVISYPIFVLTFVLLFMAKKLSVSKNEAIIFSIILLIGVVNSLLFVYPIVLFFKQFYGIKHKVSLVIFLMFIFQIDGSTVKPQILFLLSMILVVFNYQF